MSQDVSNVLGGGRGGQGDVLCVRGSGAALKAGKHSALAKPHSSSSTPPRTLSGPELLRRTADDFITRPHPPYTSFTLCLCHSVLITLIKSFVHFEISDDNLFHSTLQQWWLRREEN